MKKVIFLLLTAAVFSFPGILNAQGKGISEEIGNQNRGTPGIKKENKGGTEPGVKNEVLETENNNSTVPRNERAREQMSEVAQAVEDLILNQGAMGGIGEQVREIARQQKQAQEEISEEFEKLKMKKGLLKTLFGPDFKAIRNLNQLMEQNRQRILELEKLAVQIKNQADLEKIRETVMVLNQQNNALQEQVKIEQKTKSLFGWLSAFFSR